MINVNKIFLVLTVILLSGCDSITDIYEDVKNQVSPPEFDRQINQRHKFEVKNCDVYYNNQLLMFKTPIDDWVRVLGSYSREPSGIPEMFVWDDFGLAVRVEYNTNLVSSIEWFYRREPTHSMEYISNPNNHIGGEETAKALVELELSWPKDRFKDSIIVDGLLMDDQFNLEELNQSRREVGLDPFYVSNYRYTMMFDKICNDAHYKFTIAVNEKDPSKVNSLRFTDMRRY